MARASQRKMAASPAAVLESTPPALVAQHWLRGNGKAAAFNRALASGAAAPSRARH